ncbi:YceD family protein [Roseospira marina]|nr:YceD family protein [Roseospira marina]MBB4312295.1 uncharacterized metal-binding protein YceD (DUF177 family) [Roseospira marina]MBB5085689.1 uncharacterized metal-binding protein YceD (DUF177 family) [Roseospira marina]
MTVAPEFSRPLPAEPLPPRGRTLTVEADADERAALADRFDLDRLDRFAATVTLRPLGGRRGVVRVELTGTLEVEALRTCVVTLKPLPCTITESLMRRFSSAADDGPGDAELDIDPDSDEDPPDPIVDGLIDVGEALAEAFGLALDPHPRAPGAEISDEALSAGALGSDSASESESAASSPFAALAGLGSARRNR